MDRRQTDDRRTDVDIPQRDREFTFAENILLAFDGIFCSKQTELSDSQRMSSVDVYNHFSCRGRCCCLCWMANRYVVLLMLVVGVFASTRKHDNRYDVCSVIAISESIVEDVKTRVSISNHALKHINTFRMHLVCRDKHRISSPLFYSCKMFKKYYFFSKFDDDE